MFLSPLVASSSSFVQTAGRDSRSAWTALKSVCTKLVGAKHNSIPVQISIIRHMGESTGLQDKHHRVFTNRHGPLTMFRKVEVLLIWYSIALQSHVLSFNIAKNCRGDAREFLSIAQNKISSSRLNSHAHSYTHTIHVHRSIVRWLLFIFLANLRTHTIVLVGFFGPGFICQNCGAQNNSIARQTLKVEQSGDRQVVLNCLREDHFVLFFVQINCFVCAFFIF